MVDTCAQCHIQNRHSKYQLVCSICTLTAIIMDQVSTVIYILLMTGRIQKFALGSEE